VRVPNPLAELSDLTAAAHRRIQAAEVRATELLLQKTSTAWRQFNESEMRSKGRRATFVKRVKALQRAYRSDLQSKIEACAILFDALATEYLSIDTNPSAYSDRLMQVVYPAVRLSLPIHDPDKVISEATLARVMSWVRRGEALNRNLGEPTKAQEHRKNRSESTPRRANSIPRAISFAVELPAQVIDRLRYQKGWTLEELAGCADLNIKQVYRVKHGDGVHIDTIRKISLALGCEPGCLMPNNRCSLSKELEG